MKIVINGKEIALREKDILIAKKALDRFVKTIKDGAVENNLPTLYIALLAVMKVKATDLLNSLNSEQVEEIVRLLDRPAIHDLVGADGLEEKEESLYF